MVRPDTRLLQYEAWHPLHQRWYQREAPSHLAALETIPPGGWIRWSDRTQYEWMNSYQHVPEGVHSVECVDDVLYLCRRPLP